MDIQSFFQLCEGKWVSQRTTHHLIEQNNQSARSDLWGEILDPNHAEVAHLCQQLGLDPAGALCGLQLRWSEVTEAYQSRFKPSNQGSVLLVPMQNPEVSPEASPKASNSGQLLHLNDGTAAVGTYNLGDDEALTLTFAKAGAVAQERIWFASPNLRLRSSSVKQDGVICITTFCSEIRMNSPVADSTAETSVVQGR